MKIFDSLLLNDRCKISPKLRWLPQCILDMKAEIEEKEIPFGHHKQMTGEGMSVASHCYFPHWLTKLWAH